MHLPDGSGLLPGHYVQSAHARPQRIGRTHHRSRGEGETVENVEFERRGQGIVPAVGVARQPQSVAHPGGFADVQTVAGSRLRAADANAIALLLHLVVIQSNFLFIRFFFDSLFDF